MKPIWNGSLSFGLVNIPVKVYSATEEHALEFHLLHKKDLSPIRYAKICKKEGKEISQDEIVKGYEYEKGEYVVVDEADFKAASGEKSSAIEILFFTKIEEIEPIYFEKPYFLEPEKKAEKAYRLLDEALNTSQKVAIVRFIFRNKEHIGAILTAKEGLLLIQMRYEAEIRSAADLHIPKEKVSPKELDMALALVEQLTKGFNPEEYHDSYVDKLNDVIEKKLKGTKAPAKPKKASVAVSEAADLMQLLQNSLKKAVGKSESPKAKSSTASVPGRKTSVRKGAH